MQKKKVKQPEQSLEEHHGETKTKTEGIKDMYISSTIGQEES